MESVTIYRPLALLNFHFRPYLRRFAPCLTTMAISVDTCVAQHIGDRKEQQDRVALIPHPTRPGLLLAVLADGMGGHSGGAMAAEQVIHKSRQAFAAYAPDGETPQELLKNIIEESHIVIKLTRFTSEQDPHSTATVLLLQKGQVTWAHSGDSRIYHFHGDKLVTRSTDHSLVAEMVRQGRITETQALSHPQRNVLLGCLGADRPPTIDYGEAVPPRASDCFLMCSDGLWAYFSETELGGVLAANAPRAAAEILIQRARERAHGAGDNISVAIIKLTPKPEANPKPRQRSPGFGQGHGMGSR